MSADILSKPPIPPQQTPFTPPDTGQHVPLSAIPPQHDPLNHQQQPRWADSSSSDEHKKLSHRLLQLDYTEKLPLEAVPLVRHLLADLIRTTDALRRVRTDLDISYRDAKQAKDQVTPYKLEIARLTAENNHLHSDIIKLADERDARERRASQMARRLESQVADLRFMASQYAHRVEIEQKRVEESRQKAEEALAKL
ncbi:hypothetical protein HK097_004129, partial [Rhizophlyctis rosea]